MFFSFAGFAGLDQDRIDALKDVLNEIKDLECPQSPDALFFSRLAENFSFEKHKMFSEAPL